MTLVSAELLLAGAAVILGLLAMYERLARDGRTSSISQPWLLIALGFGLTAGALEAMRRTWGGAHSAGALALVAVLLAAAFGSLAAGVRELLTCRLRKMGGREPSEDA